MTLGFSRGLAIVFGVLLPIVETVRRWPQLTDLSMWPAWLDDFIIAGFLLYGAYRTSEPNEGRRYLAAAWGIAFGMAYGSFFGQLMRSDSSDPSGIPVVWVLSIKAAGLLLIIAALVGSLRSSMPNMQATRERARV